MNPVWMTMHQREMSKVREDCVYQNNKVCHKMNAIATDISQDKGFEVIDLWNTTFDKGNLTNDGTHYMREVYIHKIALIVEGLCHK